MNFKKKFILSAIFILIVLMSVVNYNNKNKTSIKLLIWESNEISLGNLVSICVISGLSLSAFSSIIMRNKDINESTEDLNVNNKSIGVDVEEENKYSSRTETKPPERDIREMQPTVSVNYRVISNKSNGDSSEMDDSVNPKNDDDWDNLDEEWE